MRAFTSVFQYAIWIIQHRPGPHSAFVNLRPFRTWMVTITAEYAETDGRRIYPSTDLAQQWKERTAR